jgi:hypothetical protein
MFYLFIGVSSQPQLAASLQVELSFVNFFFYTTLRHPFKVPLAFRRFLGAGVTLHAGTLFRKFAFTLQFIICQ